ncbi:MAG TPA: LysM peptidoglycan-binding domain-containing protein [Tepidisphaeraceae bacterium]|nr:LysM peptidoglycan-binding domain-containing protein [Tepidisphaeraceae bacterium]
MTKETKIGLLVGLAFLIVIGILLSDHFHGMEEPPPATLNGAGANVRQAVIAPGANQPMPPAIVMPDQTAPPAVVQTTRDIEPQPSPVIVGNLPTQSQSTLPASDPLQQAARQQGQELVMADNTPQSAAAASRGMYKAVAGDSVSRMAAKLLGANTYKNRQAIIDANPSLQDDPDMVVVGRSYVIPGSTRLSPAAAVSNGTSPTLAAASGGPWVYKVKEGDTLWGIATGQLNNASAIEAIKELNSDILHGGSTIQPGMKLRLPSAPVAVAN